MTEKILKQILTKVTNIEDMLKKGEHVEIIDELEKNTSSPKIHRKTSENPYELMVSKLRVKKDSIEDRIEIGENIKILCDMRRIAPIEEQALFLLAYLTIKKITKSIPEINSGELREILSENQISLSNLSTNMKKIVKYILHKSGKRGSTNTSYKITHEGFSKGLFILGEIVSGKKVSEIKLDFLNLKIKRKSSNSGFGSEINKLVDEGFFNEYKSSSETVKEMHTRSFFNRRQDIDAYLRKVLLGKKLLRERIDNKWKYIIKK